MLKTILYIFAVLGLLISPVNAVAAQIACVKMAPSMQITVLNGHDNKMMAMPCCDEEKDSTSPDTACFQNCIAMSGISAVSDLTPPPGLPVLHIEPIVFAPVNAQLTADEPALFAPPPRLHA